MNNNKREQLLTILGGEIGESTVHGDSDEVSFHCPFCHHHKKKLAVNLESGNWHCWVCNSAGKSLYSLLNSVDADESSFIQLKGVVGRGYVKKRDNKDTEVFFELPKEFIPITDAKKSYELKHAVNYLKRRGLKRDDIIKYNIGYCEEGLYKHYIIIPSYDENNKLNYFVARSYYDKGYSYKNPKKSKDQLIFGNMISFNLPIILVEGVFDAISVKRNAIPLLGKRLQPTVYNKLIQNEVKDVYIMLDNDAKEEAIDIAQKLQSQHINTYVVEIGSEDPADMGTLLANEKIKETELTDYSKLIKLQFG